MTTTAQARPLRPDGRARRQRVCDAPAVSHPASAAGLVLASASERTGTLRIRAASGWLDGHSLLHAAQGHDRGALEQLLERYRPLLDAAVRHTRPPAGHDRDDLAQEARIALLRAIARWRPERGPFAPFARTCVRNHLLNGLARAGSEKHQILSRALQLTGRALWLDLPAADELLPFQLAIERVATPSADPEAVVLAPRAAQAVRSAMQSLSAWEQTALKATLNGASHRQIALYHDVSTRAVTLAVRRSSSPSRPPGHNRRRATQGSCAASAQALTGPAAGDTTVVVLDVARVRTRVGLRRGAARPRRSCSPQ